MQMAIDPKRFARGPSSGVALILVLGLLLGTARAGGKAGTGYDLAQEARFSERRNGKGGLDWRAVVPGFKVVRVALTPKQPVDMLVVQRLESVSHSDAEGEESSLTVSGWIDGAGRFDRRLWTFTDAADAGAMQRYGDLYEATKLGCCGGEDVHDYYSVKTGRQTGTATAEAMATVSIPNTPTWRMVAYHGANGQRPPGPKAPVANLLGVLSLGSDDGVRRRVGVTAAGVEPWTPRLKVRLNAGSEETDRLDLWAADKNPSPAGIKGCEVRLVFEDTKALVIPIAADDFDLAHATLPAGFRLVRLDGAAP